jgi:hypothetical protein
MWFFSFCSLLIGSASPASMEALLRKYAPEVRLHGDEQYFPASIDWYLRHCELCYAPNRGDD